MVMRFVLPTTEAALAAIAAVAVAGSRMPPIARSRTMDYVSVALFALGVYWFAGRSLTLA